MKGFGGFITVSRKKFHHLHFIVGKENLEKRRLRGNKSQ